MVIVDDHLALLALVGRLPHLSIDGPVATTWAFQFRIARALFGGSRRGALSRSIADPIALVGRVMHPPADRLLVLDPRASVDEVVRIAVEHGANLLFAELVGAAVRQQAAVRVTPGNVGRDWERVMALEGLDFAVVSP